MFMVQFDEVRFKYASSNKPKVGVNSIDSSFFNYSQTRNEVMSDRWRITSLKYCNCGFKWLQIQICCNRVRMPTTGCKRSFQTKSNPTCVAFNCLFQGISPCFQSQWHTPHNIWIMHWWILLIIVLIWPWYWQWFMIIERNWLKS